MLSCIYSGEPFTTKQEGFSTKDKYRLGQEKKLLCPVCKKPIFYCDEGKKISYFVHFFDRILYSGKVYDVKYLIIKKQGDKKGLYLICRKENEASNIRYSIDINPFLDSMNKVKIMKYEIL